MSPKWSAFRESNKHARVPLLPKLPGMSVREMFWYKIPTTETANLVFVSNFLDDLKVEVEWLKPIFVEFNVTTVHTAYYTPFES